MRLINAQILIKKIGLIDDCIKDYSDLNFEEKEVEWNVSSEWFVRMIVFFYLCVLRHRRFFLLSKFS